MSIVILSSIVFKIACCLFYVYLSIYLGLYLFVLFFPFTLCFLLLSFFSIRFSLFYSFSLCYSLLSLCYICLLPIFISLTLSFLIPRPIRNSICSLSLVLLPRALSLAARSKPQQK